MRSILGVSLAGFTVLACVTLTGTALMRMTSNRMYHKILTPLRYISQVSAEFDEIRVEMNDTVQSGGSSGAEQAAGTGIHDHADTISAYFTQIEQNLNEYSKFIDNDEQKRNLESIRYGISFIKKDWGDLQTLQKQNNASQAQLLLQSSVSMDQDISLNISNSIQAKLTEAQQANERAAAVYIGILCAVGAVLILSVLLARTLSRRLTRRISRPIEQAAYLADRLAQGDFNVTAVNATDYEMRMLYESLRKIADSLRRMHADIGRLIQAAGDGRLDARADPAVHPGGFGEIIRGVNRMLDTMKAPLDASAIFLAKLAAGTAQEPLENRFSGYYGALVNNLNKVHRSLSILQEETGRLAKAGRAGNLQVRSDETRLNGFYRQIIRGCNETLDACAKPAEEAMRVLDKMAVHDFSADMSDSYAGDFSRLAAAIRTVRDSFVKIEAYMTQLGKGDVSGLETLRAIGRRSENDRLTPAVRDCFASIRALVDQAGVLSQAAYQGRLEVRGDEEQFHGSFRSIIAGMNRTMEAVAAPLTELDRVLGEAAANNLTTGMEGQYAGQYDQIRQSLGTTLGAFNHVLGQIHLVTTQVDIGSRQLSEASQSLSQGTSEQAESLEQLTGSVSSVTGQTRRNAENAARASEIAQQALQSASHGNEKMKQMLAAIREIDRSSASISKIIQVIDDIAYQTNILALNAAVEAARAGQYGRGFSVVAGEVRSLAVRTAKAARETTALIESSAETTAAGTRSAEETAARMQTISANIRQCAALVGDISHSSSEQAAAIAQIDQGLSRISAVVQTNSATAEESAASSEELSSQVTALRQMMDTFRLRSAQN